MASAILDLQKEIEAELARLKEAAPEPTSSKIEVPQGKKQFHFPTGEVIDDKPFRAVIIDWRWQNSYFPTAFNPKQKSKPVCFARHSDPKLMTPHASSEQPQCSDCASCPMNKFGSKGNGKACKNVCILAIVPPDATDKTKPFTLAVSPTGLKTWNAFERHVRNGLGKIPIQLITEIAFDPKEDYATLTFKEVGLNENLATCFALRAKAAEILDRGDRKEGEDEVPF